MKNFVLICRGNLMESMMTLVTATDNLGLVFEKSVCYYLNQITVGNIDNFWRKNLCRFFMRQKVVIFPTVMVTVTFYSSSMCPRSHNVNLCRILQQRRRLWWLWLTSSSGHLHGGVVLERIGFEIVPILYTHVSFRKLSKGVIMPSSKKRLHSLLRLVPGKYLLM